MTETLPRSQLPAERAPVRRRKLFSPKGGAAGLWAAIRQHRAFTVLLLVGLLLRATASAGFVPALWFNDAFEYVAVALRPTPYPLRPDGYSFVLGVLEPAHSFALVVALQHLLGLAIAVLVYRIVRSFGLPAWGGCLAAAPVLLDAYEIELEQVVLSDTIFTLLAVLAVSLGLRRMVSARTGAAIGLLLAAAMLTRPAALPVIALLILWLLIRRVGWRPLASFAVALTIALGAYATWYHSAHGAYALDSSTGIQLYGRVAGFADCRVIKPGPALAPLCPTNPGNGATAPTFIWHPSPLTRLPGPTFTPGKDRLARSFAQAAILAQPGDYLKAVATDIGRAFAWQRGPYPNAYTTAGWDFSQRPWPVTDRPALGDPGSQLVGRFTQRSAIDTYERHPAQTRLVQPFADAMIGYQQVVFIRGTMLAALFLLTAIGLIAPGRPGGVPRLPLLLLGGCGLSLLLLPIFTVQIDYRYMIPSYPFAGAAAVLGAARLLAWLRRTR